MNFISRRGVDPAGLAAGLTAYYAASTVLLFSIATYAVALHDHGVDYNPFSFVSDVSKLPFGRLMVVAAILIGACVGAYAAAAYSRGRELRTGIAVGIALVVIRVVTSLVLLIGFGRFSPIDLVIMLLLVPASLPGARLGRYQRQRWNRQCEKLDGWQDSSGGP